jgi:hypothetical protein
MPSPEKPLPMIATSTSRGAAEDAAGAATGGSAVTVIGSSGAWGGRRAAYNRHAHDL